MCTHKLKLSVKIIRIDLTLFAFIMYRYILGSVALAEEIIANCHYFGDDGILLKLDFEKAYNMVD